jgi:hypothetical protein
MKRKIPLKNIIKYSLKYFGKDEKKLKAIYEFLNILFEEKLKKIEDGIEDIKVSFSSQKKIELKLDRDLMMFLDEAKKRGKSASGLLCEILCKVYKIEYNFNTRKPREKKLKGTVSLKIPSSVWNIIESEEKSQESSKIIRKVIKQFLENKIKLYDSREHDNKIAAA